MQDTLADTLVVLIPSVDFDALNVRTLVLELLVLCIFLRVSFHRGFRRGVLLDLVMLIYAHADLVFAVIVLEDVVCELDPILAATDPGGFWHRSINLLQGKLVLDGFFVDVWDHIRRLDERH